MLSEFGQAQHSTRLEASTENGKNHLYTYRSRYDQRFALQRYSAQPKLLRALKRTAKCKRVSWATEDLNAAVSTQSNLSAYYDDYWSLCSLLNLARKSCDSSPKSGSVDSNRRVEGGRRPE